MLKKYCEDCALPESFHVQSWIEEIRRSLLPQPRIFRRLEPFFAFLLERFFRIIGLVKMESNFSLFDIQARSACFIKEARARGVEFKAAKGPFGYTNHFWAEVHGRQVTFDSLPLAGHVGKHDISFVDCKERTKKYLEKGNFPIAAGKFFWFWQEKQALNYGISKLGFPLVVKPRGGSVARHVTTDIGNEKGLKLAINKAIVYSPVFTVERFIGDAFVHRATVVDFDYVAVVRQEPASVTGDGKSTIQELATEKNNSRVENPVLHKIVIDKTTAACLNERNYDLKTVLRMGEAVYLQKDPFVRLGGDLCEVTSGVHPDNLQLFKDIAKFFDMRLVGIDFMVLDISKSWRNQETAVLELNSAPCIEVHQYPSSGKPQNVARAVSDLFFKYYL